MNTKWPCYSRPLGLCVMLWALSCAPGASAAPLAHWTFDTTEGVFRDAVGSAHGRMEGEWSPEFVRPGVFGRALLFEAGKRRVCVPHSASISLHDDFTLECVIKPFRTDGFRTIFWKGDRTVTPEVIGYYFDLRDGRPELKTKDAAGKWLVYSAADVVEAHQWQHLVFTYAAGKVEISINGVSCKVSRSEDGEQAQSLLENPYDATLGDGASAQGSAYSFDGLIDDLRIHAGRETTMFGDDYPARWQQLHQDCATREQAFEEERARLAAEAARQLDLDYDALLAANSARPEAPFVATVLPATERLNGSPDFFRSIRAFGRTAVCSAARNEYEGFQVILLGRRDMAPTGVSVTVSDLVREDKGARIPADHLAWGRIERVTTEPPDLPVPFVGAIPDVIIEDGAPATVSPRDFGALFCRIGTGDAPAGRYLGELKLTAGTFSETIRIELTVYDFALPRKGSLRTAFCFFESYYRTWYGVKDLSDAQREGIYEFLLRYRLSPSNIYSGDAPFPAVRFLEKYRDQINFFTVGRLELGTAAETEATVAKRVELFREIRELGLEDSMYFYSFDELSMNMKGFPAAVKTSAALRAAWPELKMMQTSFPVPELQPLYNAWVPLLHEFAKEEGLAVLQSMRQRGDEVWWYAADSPRHPCPNFFLDYPVFDCRIIGTLSYIQDVEGVLYWCINREWPTNQGIREQWPAAPWKAHIYHAHTGQRKYKNGMGNLVYPGKEGQLNPSLRLENLRDGLEDHEYFCALRAAVARLAATDTPEAKALLPQAQALQKVPADVGTAINSWSQDPTYLLAYRDKVARMVEQAAHVTQR